MSISSSGDIRGTEDLTNNQPDSGVLPEGSTSFTAPSGITGSGDIRASEDFINGAGASGVKAKGGKTVEGVLEAEYDGTAYKTKQTPDEPYAISGVPTQVEQGPSGTGSGGFQIRLTTEAGGVSTESFSPHFQRNVDFLLGEVVVTVQDAVGNNLAGKPVQVEGRGATTTSDGTVSVGTSGSVTVKGIEGTVERNVSLSAGETKNVTLSYSGVFGTINGPSGNPVNRAIVTVRDTDDTVLAKVKTDSSGQYEFNELPIKNGLSVEAGPFSRTFDSASEGNRTQKNLPLNAEFGAVKVEAFDSVSDSNISNLRCDFEGFVARTDNSGVVTLLGQPTTEGKPVRVAEGDRRYILSVSQVTVNDAQLEELEFTLDRRENIGGAN